MRLLIVEDDVKLVRALTRGLEAQGYGVEGRLRRRHRPRAGDREDYDAIVLDVMLPGRDGFAVCEALRRDDRVPVLMLTARTDVGDRIRGLDIGADDYLVKPFDFGELVARLRALHAPAVPEAVAAPAGGEGDAAPRRGHLVAARAGVRWS